MTGDAAPPELPPRLLEEYRRSVREQLGVLTGLADRIAARADDRQALDALRREAHKIHGSAGSYGYWDASRLAAGMEETLKDWVARPDDPEVDRGSLMRWFVTRLAELLQLELPGRGAVPAPPANPLPRLIIRRPSAPTPTPSAPPHKAPRETAPGPHPARPTRAAVPPTVPPVAEAQELPWLIPPRAPQPEAAPQPPPDPPRPALEPRPPVAAPPDSEAPPAPPAAAEPPQQAAAPAAASGDVPELIVVEDDPALAELLEFGLRARGYRFLSYRSGRDALRDLRVLDVGGTRPLVLLDVDLPGLDGYSVLDALERDRPGVYRVVFTTVHGTETEQLRGLEAGALDYLVKPISLRVALEKIRRWVGR